SSLLPLHDALPTSGPTGVGGFHAEHGRYHLFVSYACPWAHRTLIFRTLKGLTNSISVSVVEPLMLANGWEFGPEKGMYGSNYLYKFYKKIDPEYTGRVTVPLIGHK